MELDVVDLGDQGIILEKFHNQVPHIIAETPQILFAVSPAASSGK